MLVKVEATYSDGSSEVITGNPVDISLISSLSPDERNSAESAKNLAAKETHMDEEVKTDAEVSNEPAPVTEAPATETPATEPAVDNHVNG